jgi:hypothetical protein
LLLERTFRIERGDILEEGQNGEKGIVDVHFLILILILIPRIVFLIIVIVAVLTPVKFVIHLSNLFKELFRFFPDFIIGIVNRSHKRFQTLAP